MTLNVLLSIYNHLGSFMKMFIIILSLINSVSVRADDLKKIDRRNYNYNPVQLPEVIVNSAGYNYPIPNPPFQFDEPPSDAYLPPRTTTQTPIFQDEIPQIPTYLPPPIYPPLTPDLNPPQFDPIPTDDTPLQPPNNNYLPPSTYGVPNFKSLQLNIINMSCVDATTQRYFRSTFRASQFLEYPPIIENGISDCVYGSGEYYRIDIEGNRMTQCGIRYCGDKSLCLKMRLPSVKGLKLPEDMVITLQCKMQDSIATHTKQLRINPHVVQARSLGTIASGGSQRNFESQVALYRRSPSTNDFNQIVTPGSSVILGEDLLLRASVRDGDGWKYSRMGAVIMQRGRTVARDSVTLVDNLGCRVHAMRSVCPEQPRQVNPLLTTMPFRAFMFQGPSQNDEMILSVRMYACLQHEDCAQARSCEEKVQGRTRAKRETKNGSRTADNITDWESYLDFKVVLPELHPQTKQVKVKSLLYNPGVYLGSIFCLACIFLFLLVLSKRK